MSKIITPARLNRISRSGGDEKLIDNILSRGAEDVIEKEHLKNALLSGKQLRVKFGIDPTAADLHLGHTVPLRKLKEFQDLGHKIVLIIGDFTAKIGDPTGRSKEREPLTDKDVKNNMKDYLKQAGRILDLKKADIFYNNKWFKKEGMAEVLMLSGAGSIQQILRRADFKKRLSEGSDITLTEALYPLLQAYDSVKVKADVEIGGTDQLFNLLMGRRVQRHYDMPEQDVLTVPLLVGTDGVKKMSKSTGNYISLSDKPFEMLEGIMRMTDSSLEKHAYNITDDEAAEKWIKSFKSGEDLRKGKLELAENIVAMYNSEREAKEASEEYEKRSKGQWPDDDKYEEINLSSSMSLKNAIINIGGVTSSTSAAAQLVKDGVVKINDEIQTDWNNIVKDGDKLQIGKKRFIKIKI